MTKEETEQKTPSTSTEKQQNEKLLRLKTGYDQHATPFQLYATTQRTE